MRLFQANSVQAGLKRENEAALLRVDDGSWRVQYGGQWAASSVMSPGNQNASTIHTSDQAGSTVKFAFNGQSLLSKPTIGSFLRARLRLHSAGLGSSNPILSFCLHSTTRGPDDTSDYRNIRGCIWYTRWSARHSLFHDRRPRPSNTSYHTTPSLPSVQLALLRDINPTRFRPTRAHRYR